MLVQLVTTERTRCEVGPVVALVNALQYFFVVRNEVVSVGFPETIVAQPLLHPSVVTRFVRSEVATQFSSPPAFTVLLTSHFLAIANNGSTFREDDVSVISNHLWRMADMPETFRFARHILQLGLSRLLKHSSRVRSCIAGPQEGFDCLCDDCEGQLITGGFRDGVLFLKDSLNTLNQLQAGGGLSITDREPGSQFGELKLARDYVAEFRKGQISLENHVIAIVLHFLSDLVPFVKSLHELGANYSDIYLVAKPYPYARRDEVSHILQSLGVNVERALTGTTVTQCATAVLRELQFRNALAEKRLLVIEDGGYFAPLLHQPDFSQLLDRCVGIVEQTQKGADDDKKIKNLAVPILSVAESAFKKMYESPEIGRVAVQNIARFTPNVKLSGRHATVFGFGSVGQEVAHHLNNSFNMTVSVVDPKLEALLRARHKKSIVAEAAERFEGLKFQKPALIVGTTGKTSITRGVLEQLTEDTVLVSTSSDQIEIDLKALNELASGRIWKVVEGKTIYTVGDEKQFKDVTLLAEGYPINFYGSESLPNDTIDPIMTLLLLCGVELTLRNDLKKEVDAEMVGVVVEKRGLVARFLQYA